MDSFSADFHGDTECDRQFQSQAGKEKSGYGGCQQCESGGRRIQGDTNVLTLITQDEEISLPLMSKEDAAFRILDKILSLMQDSVC